MNINSPMAFVGPWARYTSARPFGSAQGKRGGLGNRFNTPYTHWTKDRAKLLAGPFGKLRTSFALHYTAQGKRETLVSESEGRANVIWRRRMI